MSYKNEPSWRKFLMNWLFARKGCLILTVTVTAPFLIAVFLVVPALFMGDPPCVVDEPPCMP